MCSEALPILKEEATNDVNHLGEPVWQGPLYVYERNEWTRAGQYVYGVIPLDARGNEHVDDAFQWTL